MKAVIQVGENANIETHLKNINEEFQWYFYDSDISFAELQVEINDMREFYDEIFVILNLKQIQKKF